MEMEMMNKNCDSIKVEVNGESRVAGWVDFMGFKVTFMLRLALNPSD